MDIRPSWWVQEANALIRREDAMKVMKAILSGAALFVLSAPAIFAQSATTNETPQTIQQRKENQQDRIAQGIKSGQSTPGETAKLEKQQQGINREVAGMREANGGKLTAADKKAVNQQQNQASRNIYNKKHNGRRQ
jgi:hypothetical protein